MTHMHGMTVEALRSAQNLARSTDKLIELTDDTAHVIYCVTPRGKVITRPQDWLYRVAER